MSHRNQGAEKSASNTNPVPAWCADIVSVAAVLGDKIGGQWHMTTAQISVQRDDGELLYGEHLLQGGVRAAKSTGTTLLATVSTLADGLCYVGINNGLSAEERALVDAYADKLVPR